MMGGGVAYGGLPFPGTVVLYRMLAIIAKYEIIDLGTPKLTMWYFILPYYMPTY